MGCEELSFAPDLASCTHPPRSLLATALPLTILPSLPPYNLKFPNQVLSDLNALGCLTPPTSPLLSWPGIRCHPVTMRLLSWLHRSKQLGRRQRFGCVSIAPHPTYIIIATSLFVYLIIWKSSDLSFQVNDAFGTSVLRA